MQQHQAQELHREAEVAYGPCGLEELRQFQQALGPQYQLLVMTRMKPFFFIFKGPAAPHQIRLLKSSHHFDGCTSFPRVADLRVKIMCVVPGPRSIAPCVIASFTVPIANAIMWSPSNVNRSKPLSSARPSTRSFPTDATSAGTPNVPCVKNRCPSMTISFTFNPW